MSYTDGPWRLKAGDETEIMAGKLNIGRANCGGLTGIKIDEAEDNARLMSASLALFEALGDLLLSSCVLDSLRATGGQELIDAAKAAMTKARGD